MQPESDNEICWIDVEDGRRMEWEQQDSMCYISGQWTLSPNGLENTEYSKLDARPTFQEQRTNHMPNVTLVRKGEQLKKKNSSGWRIDSEMPVLMWEKKGWNSWRHSVRCANVPMSPSLASKCMSFHLNETTKWFSQVQSCRKYADSCAAWASNFPNCRTPGVSAQEGPGIHWLSCA